MNRGLERLYDLFEENLKVGPATISYLIPGGYYQLFILSNDGEYPTLLPIVHNKAMFIDWKLNARNEKILVFSTGTTYLHELEEQELKRTWFYKLL